MYSRVASFLLIAFVGATIGCKKTTDVAPATVAPTSMVGTWRITALELSPKWPKVVNGSPEYFSDYVQFLKRINETCLTDVNFTFAANGQYTSDVASQRACSNGGGSNSRFVVDYLAGPGATYVEKADSLRLRGAAQVTHLDVAKTYGPNKVTLQWKLDRDMSDELVPTTYTLTLTKQAN